MSECGISPRMPAYRQGHFMVFQVSKYEISLAEPMEFIPAAGDDRLSVS